MTLSTAETTSSAETTTSQATKAGLAYMAAVFAAGFILGTLRVFIITPKLGELAAMSMELPIMLAISWLICPWINAYFAVPVWVSARLVMGGVAFAALMIAETTLSVLAFGRPLTEHLSRYREWPTLLGLAGQIAFAAIPMLQASRSRA